MDGMARSGRTIWVAAGAVVVLGAAALAGWWSLVRDDAPPEADIDAARETLDEAATPGTGEVPSDAAAVDGTWTVDRSLGSFADHTSSVATCAASTGGVAADCGDG
jgi:hypothetical protein